MYSFISFSIESTPKNDQLLLVYPDGSVYWIHGLVITTQCTIDVRFFPFDTQNCIIDFGSWMYPSSRMNLTIDDTKVNHYYKDIGVWHTMVYTRYFVLTFPDYGEYPVVAVELILSRGSLYYVLVIIIPCTLIALINLMVFLLPVESGEKVSLGITNYLALVLTQQLVGELTPPVPDRLPIILCKFHEYLR